MKNLSPTEFSDLLIKLGACKEASTWAKGKSLSKVWNNCRRGDWLLWLVVRYGDTPRKTIAAIACDCAEPALIHTQDQRPAECIATVRRWLKDEATLVEVRAAWAAAWAAWTAAWTAAWAAADAAGAAWTAAWAAADAAGAAARAAWTCGVCGAGAA